jgi:two-component sensor histidine kinase
MLTVALLPLGLIALYQTREFQRETERRTSLSLLAVTGQSAAGLQQAIERALGAAESLAVVVDLLDDPATCSATLRRYVEEPQLYAFVGLLPGDGPVTCSSAPAAFDLEDREDMAALMADRRPRVRATAQGPVSGQEVVVVLSPIGGEGGFDGYLGLSIPRDRIPDRTIEGGHLLRLVTFNADGAVLTSDPEGVDAGDLQPFLPAGRALADEARGLARSFLGRDGQGREWLYTVTPVVPDVAYALGIWSPVRPAGGLEELLRAPILFPLLMWGASLLVAFWAIHRFVIRQVAALGQRMRRFGRDRSLPEPLASPDAAHEIREIDDAFRQTAEAILHDEARMENAFRERGVLLKEVHHRVKNNLQLISSIISMQVRRAPDLRTRALLRRLQDRVLTLAAIYRSLYTVPDMTDVNAAEVLRATVGQALRDRAGAAEVSLQIEDLALDPDKVVPLAFLAAEAVSNALAHVGAAQGRPRLAVTFVHEGPMATLTVTNTMPGPLPTPLDDPGQGLGRHLIHAFAAQVGGPAQVTAEDGVYRVAVTFPVEDATSEAA